MGKRKRKGELSRTEFAICIVLASWADWQPARSSGGTGT